MLETRASVPPSAGNRSGAPLALLAALLVVGCGAHAAAQKRAAPPTPCRPAPRAVIAGALGVPPGSLSAVPGIANSGVPRCSFKRAGVRVTALVDTGPQAYFRLERTIVEDSQQFSTVRLEPAPEHVAKLGLDAAWFPGEQQVMTTDGSRLITVAVHWPRVMVRRRRALATAMARTYLGRLRPSAADPNGSS